MVWVVGVFIYVLDDCVKLFSFPDITKNCVDISGILTSSNVNKLQTVNDLLYSKPGYGGMYIRATRTFAAMGQTEMPNM